MLDPKMEHGQETLTAAPDPGTSVFPESSVARVFTATAGLPWTVQV
jgi:hypothetical protein